MSKQAPVVGYLLLLSPPKPVTNFSTPCNKLVFGWPYYIGVKDASSHVIESIITGEVKECILTVFPPALPDDVTELFHTGKIINFDLEMAKLLMLWLVIKEVCPKLQSAYIALFRKIIPLLDGSNNLRQGFHWL